ncbi:hypothetical protein LX59_00920 [Azomonas agilis]|uniref:Uncharacterized protein n=1 Tax=Azomonas agilis TaxID=116849 RepID=A0A562J208_9GAMM|nr:hypothetical protein [Azomonas agilis]TWH76875.1 hypothetical protein LX59_00920 [Azomonas agilis]
MSSVTQTQAEQPIDWPRDFDIRACYAEQQELLPEDRHTHTSTLQEDCHHD